MDDLILDTQNSFFVNEIVMIELFHLLIKQKGAEGFKISSEFLNGNYPSFKCKYDLLQVSDLYDVLNLLNRYGNISTIGGRDSTIIHSMLTHNIENIITTDAGFAKVDSIQVHNPISNGQE